MNINLYLACILIGIGIFTLLKMDGIKKENVFSYKGFSFAINYPVVNFSVSVLFVLIFNPHFHGGFEILFCSIALIMEGLNFKWKSSKSSAYAIFVGVITLVFHVWMPANNTLMLGVSFVIAAIIFALITKLKVLTINKSDSDQ